MQNDFKRVAIVNRGEAAMRFIHAAREYNRENGTRLATIGLYTEPDRHAMFVREADEAVCLGAAQVIDEISHHPKSSYVDYRTLERALTATHADAAWVGWGFVAEHAAFADLCRDLGVVFIGPEGEAMRRLGDKITSKLLAEAAYSRRSLERRACRDRFAGGARGRPARFPASHQGHRRRRRSASTDRRSSS